MSSMKQPHRPAERNAPTAKGQGEPQVVSAAPVGLSTPGSAAEALKSARDSVAANDSKARLNKYRSSQSTALAPVPGSQQASGQPTVRLNSYRSSQSSALRSVPGAGGHKLSALERYKARRAAGGLSKYVPCEHNMPFVISANHVGLLLPVCQCGSQANLQPSSAAIPQRTRGTVRRVPDWICELLAVQQYTVR